MTMPTEVAVHCFPSADPDFRAEAQRIVAESWRRIHASERLIADVQHRLRQRYPAAIVRMRDEQAELGTPSVRTIYAFRDGRAA